MFLPISQTGSVEIMQPLLRHGCQQNTCSSAHGHLFLQASHSHNLYPTHMYEEKSRRVPPLSQKKSMKHTNKEFCRQKGPFKDSTLQQRRHSTFSTSERDDRDWFCRTSGAVNARRSWWETLSSVNDTLPDGSNRRDHGEMMNPRAAGSAVFERRKTKILQINIQLF